MSPLRSIFLFFLILCVRCGAVLASNAHVPLPQMPVPAATVPSDSSVSITDKPVGQDNSILFNRRAYDTPVINAAQFKRKHSLEHAPAYVKALCHLPDYQCVNVAPTDTWIKLFPNPVERSMIMRLNRSNVALKYRSWILVPRRWNNLQFMMFSPLPIKIQSDGHPQLIIDLKRFAFGAYNSNGDLIHWGPASGGSAKCPLSNKSCASVLGTFKIYRKHGADCFSRTYPLVSKGGAPMPYCMFYHKGYAIHASTMSGFLNHSRGCIRLFYDDAKWLNEDFVHIGTKVTVS